MRIELLGILVQAFVIGLSGALMPGPVLAVTIDQSSRRGAAAGPLIVFGHMMLEGILVAALALGFGNILKDPKLILAVHLVGGGMLGWMGQDMIRQATALSLKLDGQECKSMHPIAAGFLVSLSNPYWTLWWATIGMGYVVNGLRYGAPGVISFYVGHVLSDLLWYTSVSVAVSRGKRFMSDRAYQWLARSCGLALLLFASWFVWAGLSRA